MLLSVVLNVSWRSIPGRRDLLINEVFRCLLFVMAALGLAPWFLDVFLLDLFLLWAYR